MDAHDDINRQFSKVRRYGVYPTRLENDDLRAAQLSLL